MSSGNFLIGDRCFFNDDRSLLNKQNQDFSSHKSKSKTVENFDPVNSPNPMFKNEKLNKLD